MQQEVTRPKARFKPTLSEKSEVDGGSYEKSYHSVSDVSDLTSS